MQSDQFRALYKSNSFSFYYTGRKLVLCDGRVRILLPHFRTRSSSSLFYWFDPKLICRPPSNLGQRQESLLHRQRLEIAYTIAFRYRIGLVPLNCITCASQETILHNLTERIPYAEERRRLVEALRKLHQRQFSK